MHITWQFTSRNEFQSCVLTKGVLETSMCCSSDSDCPSIDNVVFMPIWVTAGVATEMGRPHEKLMANEPKGSDVNDAAASAAL